MFKHLIQEMLDYSWNFFSSYDRQISGSLLFFSALTKSFLLGIVVADVGIIFGIFATIIASMSRIQEMYYRRKDFLSKNKEKKNKNSELKS